MGDRSSTCRILVGKPEGKKENPHVGGRIILKRILREIRCGVTDWIDLA
jgi:hypothetical protein